jgi:hypothetical protein
MSKLWPLYRLAELIERFFPKERKEKRIGGGRSKTFLWDGRETGPLPKGLVR